MVSFAGVAWDIVLHTAVRAPGAYYMLVHLLRILLILGSAPAQTGVACCVCIKAPGAVSRFRCGVAEDASFTAAGVDRRRKTAGALAVAKVVRC
jgi:hypothetical protein